ncbi:hypothetical protein J7355_15600 [Endozoicomonas sp. G2_2]|uniref:hypothetical protein n=1 Tax=Endozoicomonas sp. G2_2 TaxID=2821092 RepID=UPI001ADBF673|nr:hypothetical protein [Endozoicomonas sp. G2_2]MBO9471514.1 hypothetical protein [Endozoicomonas sp. G2_2]
MCRTASHNERITAAEIAQALDAKRIRPGRWACCCPVPGHDDSSPSFSIAEGDTGPLVYCHAGCDQAEIIQALRSQGLWHKPTKAQLAARQRRQQADEQWRAIVRDRVNGRAPTQCPPYSRSIPATGAIQIITGEGAWELAKELRADGIHALVLPPGLPHLGVISQ